MPTSVHLPSKLLKAVDRRARQLGMSRNRFIVQALERDLSRATEWSPGFLEKFTPLEPSGARAVDVMLAAILANRKSKGPPNL
jgi:hypothetical protein